MSKKSLAKFYQDSKERLQKKIRDSNQSHSKEEKKQQHHHQWYKNVPQNDKQKVVENRKKYYKMLKTLYYNYKKSYSLSFFEQTWEFSLDWTR